MESVKFEVFSWYHNYDKELKTWDIPAPTFAAQILNSKTSKPIGLKITWGITILNEGITALKYAAYEDFLSKDKDVKEISITEIQGIVRLSHLRYRKEFDKIKMGFDLNFTIPPYLAEDINYQDLIDLLHL
jgi:hypothetical protein